MVMLKKGLVSIHRALEYGIPLVTSKIILIASFKIFSISDANLVEML